VLTMEAVIYRNHAFCHADSPSVDFHVFPG
jgi:hypothetical protein